MEIEKVIAPWLDSALVGDDYAIERIIKAIRPLLLKYLWKQHGRSGGGFFDDAVQVCSVRIWRAFKAGDRINKDKSPGWYFYQAVNNAYIDYWRKEVTSRKGATRSGVVELSAITVDPADTPTDTTDYYEITRKIVQDKFTPKTYQVFTMIYDRRMRYKEIASTLGMSVTAIKATKRRIRDGVRESLMPPV